MNTKRIVATVAFTLLGAAAFAQETPPARSPEALEILKQVDATIKKIDAVRLEASVTPSGAATQFLPASEGVTVLIGWKGNLPEKFWGEVTVRRAGSTEPEKVTGGGDGESYFLIDHKNRKGYEDIDPGVMGSGGRAVMGVAMLEFVHPTPYDDELNGEKVELLGTEKVGDEECDKIAITYAGGQGTSTWFFSRKDHLPRRRTRGFTTPQGDGAIDTVIKKIEIDPKVDASLFKMQLPEGYAKINDFAP
jgi:outer membrane lipoprotein-sorting protein